VSCRHHLLLEIAGSGGGADARPTSIRLNRQASPGVFGRRPGLRASAPAEIVRAWIRDAVEHLEHMSDSCSLDVADRGGMQLVAVAELLGVTTAAIKDEVDCADELRAGLAEWRDHVPIDHAGNLARVGEQMCLEDWRDHVPSDQPTPAGERA
jgi:hypothetical protein